MKRCPRCNNNYNTYSELANDNKTLICPTCKAKESLFIMGIPKQEIKQIILKNNQYQESKNEIIKN